MIQAYRQLHGVSPTYNELAQKLNVSVITVFEHIKALERKGAVSRRHNETRSVEIVDPRFVTEFQRPESIPVRGRIAYGRLVEMLESTGTVSVGSSFGPAQDLFALKVEDSVLVEHRILPGDWLVMKVAAPALEQGQWLLVELENGQIRLMQCVLVKSKPCLQTAHEEPVTISAANVRIRGVYCGLLRVITS